jgi:glycosyltransferase involved in cell wall biosynthesis
MPNDLINTPLVSVVIPTYNLAQYIVETVESVLMQTYPNMEVIVIDDGSKDNTDEVLAPYMSQIIYVYQENRGIAKSYNRGIEMAQGEYICFLEADDYWITADKVEKQVAMFHENPSLGYILTGWQDVNPAGDEILDYVKVWENAPDLTLHNWFLWLPTRLQCVMITRECLVAIGGFNSKYKYAGDVEMFLHMVVDGYKGAWLQEITTAYRVHQISTSHRKHVELTDEAIEIISHYVHLESHPPEIRSATKLYMFFKYIIFIHSTIRNGFIEDAIRYAKMTCDAVWFSRQYTIYDLATYLGDNFSYMSRPFDNYGDVIKVLRSTFESSDEIRFSQNLSIETDTLLHWWLCIWWRYFHAMTPENEDTTLYRHPSTFKPYSITFYKEKSIEEIIHLARVSILVSPLKIDDKTLPMLDLFCAEMTEHGVISTADQHRLIELYFAVATRALYYSQWRYVGSAMKLAIQRTQSRNLTQWGNWVKSVGGFIVRKLTRQV